MAGMVLLGLLVALTTLMVSVRAVSAADKRTALDIEELSNVFGSPNWFLDRGVPTDQLIAQLEAGQSLSEGSVSEACLESLLVLSYGTNYSQPWALYMRDALGRPMPGTYDGAILWVGSYDECLSSQTKATKWVTPSFFLQHKFHGQYCKLKWYHTEFSDFFSVGLCAPSTCSQEDITELFRYKLLNDTATRFYTDAECNDGKSVGDDPSAIFATVFFCVFAVFTIAVSLVDCCCSKRCEQWCSSPARQVELTTMKNGTSYQTFNSTENADASNNSHEAVTDAEAPPIDANMQNGTTPPQNGGGEDKPESKKHGKVVQALLAFSLFSTVPRVLNFTAPPGSYTCMNGLRFLSFGWIVLGHTWQLGLYVTQPYAHAAENFFAQEDIQGTYFHNAVDHYELAVDTFLVMSACLVTISFMKNLKRQNDRCTRRQIVLYYFHRYWRLTPLYMVILMAYTCFSQVTARGPVFPHPFYDADNCRSNFWTNLLYINNIVGLDKMCMGWSWYVAVDFQFYITVPLFAFFMYRWPKVGITMVAVVYCIHMGVTGYLFDQLVRGKLDYFGSYYFPPWTRFGPYAIGCVLGYIMFKTECKACLHKGLMYGGWFVACNFIFHSVYVPNMDSHGAVVGFYTCQRSMFALGVAWVIFACSSGYGGFVNSFLSMKIFVPLGRITYASYLVHPILIYSFYYASSRLIYVNVANMVMYYGGFLLYSTLLAFLLKIAFEEPFMLLEKAIIPKPKTT